MLMVLPFRCDWLNSSMSVVLFLVPCHASDHLRFSSMSSTWLPLFQFLVGHLNVSFLVPCHAFDGLVGFSSRSNICLYTYACAHVMYRAWICLEPRQPTADLSAYITEELVDTEDSASNSNEYPLEQKMRLKYFIASYAHSVTWLKYQIN